MSSSLIKYTEEYYFECICLHSEFYKFSMQDLSSDCAQPNGNTLFWCPDIDGPCAPNFNETSGIMDAGSSAVYCLDSAKCGFDLFLPFGENNICQIDELRNFDASQCSQNYYKCVFENGSAKWKLQKCFSGSIFSPNLNKCTQSCNENDPDDIEDGCLSDTGDEICQCFDDIGILWEAENGKIAEKKCEEFSEKLQGNQFWTCQNGIFVEENPNRSNCSEIWLPDFIDQVKDNSTSSSEDSGYLENELDNVENDEISENALNSLVNAMDNLLKKREEEMKNGNVSESDQQYFYASFMKNVDTLVR